MILALVTDYVVVAIQTVPDASAYQALAAQYQIVIDITNMLPQPQIGWTFDGRNLISNGITTTQITKLAFRERFTSTELIGIIAASMQATQTGYTLQMMLQNQTIATYIDLSRSDTIAGVGLLVSLGLITSARANTILTTPPTAMEIYQGT
jgi:hypothetical protein